MRKSLRRESAACLCYARRSEIIDIQSNKRFRFFIVFRAKVIIFGSRDIADFVNSVLEGANEQARFSIKITLVTDALRYGRIERLEFTEVEIKTLQLHFAFRLD